MNELFVRARGEVSGPFSVDEIKAKIARGELVPLHELSHDGVEWVRAGKIWDEFVPKPTSMIDSSERRPVTVKPAVQPVEIRESLSRKRKSSHGESTKPAAAPIQPSKREQPRAVKTPTPKAAPPAAPLRLRPHGEVLGNLVKVADTEREDDSQPPPEPIIGVRLIRAWTVAVGCFGLLWMGLLLVGIVLNLRMLDGLRPLTLDQLRSMLTTGLYDIAFVVRAWTFVFQAIYWLLFLFWVYFSARYLYLKSEGRMAFTPGWSVAWFLIPIANLVKPYKVVAELKRRSEQYLRFDDPRIIREPIVAIWWFCCLLQLLAGVYADSNGTLALKRRLDAAATPDDFARLDRLPQLFYDSLTMEIVSQAVGIAAGIATLVLLYKLEKVRPKWETRSRRQRKL